MFFHNFFKYFLHFYFPKILIQMWVPTCEYLLAFPLYILFLLCSGRYSPSRVLIHSSIPLCYLYHLSCYFNHYIFQAYYFCLVLSAPAYSCLTIFPISFRLLISLTLNPWSICSIISVPVKPVCCSSLEIPVLFNCLCYFSLEDSSYSDKQSKWGKPDSRPYHSQWRGVRQEMNTKVESPKHQKITIIRQWQSLSIP